MKQPILLPDAPTEKPLDFLPLAETFVRSMGTDK
jgi:hypothetical protein